MDTNTLLDKTAIRDVVESWALWRDAGEWERLHTTFHPGAIFKATWFHGPFERFVELSAEMLRRGGKSIHFLGGATVDVVGNRALSITKMQILSRSVLDGVEVDVCCNGRFYDRFEKRAGEWRIAFRDCIYDKSRVDPVEPGAAVPLDASLLQSFPEGYRHLTYAQSKRGSTITPGLATARGPEVEALYALGREWLGAK